MKVFCGFEAVSLVFVIAGILSVRSPEVKLPVGVSSDSCEQSEGAKDGQWVLKCKLEQEDVHDVPIKVPRRNKCLQMSLRLSMSCEGIFRLGEKATAARQSHLTANATAPWGHGLENAKEGRLFELCPST